jgi:hypothetical protein
MQPSRTAGRSIAAVPTVPLIDSDGRRRLYGSIVLVVRSGRRGRPVVLGWLSWALVVVGFRGRFSWLVVQADALRRPPAFIADVQRCTTRECRRSLPPVHAAGRYRRSSSVDSSIECCRPSVVVDSPSPMGVVGPSRSVADFTTFPTILPRRATQLSLRGAQDSPEKSA